MLALTPRADAAITSVLGGSVTCTVQSGANAGERHCSGIFTTFDGSPIDVNAGFPPAPASGPDGNFPIIGVFHGWGGSKLGLTDGDMQAFLDKWQTGKVPNLQSGLTGLDTQINQALANAG